MVAAEVDIQLALSRFSSQTGIPAHLEPSYETEKNDCFWSEGIVSLHSRAGLSHWQVVARPIKNAAEIAAIANIKDFSDRSLLLITSQLSPGLAQTCRTLDQAFIDTAGNAFIQKGNLLIFISGQRARSTKTTAFTGKSLTPVGLKVLFLLLSYPEFISAPFRVIARASGVSLGSVAATIADLEKRGYLIASKRGRPLILQHQAQLLEEWLLEYPLRLRPKLTCWRFAIAPETWRSIQPADYGGLWGGEPAAALLRQSLRPEQLTLYLDPVTAAKSVTQLVRDYRLRHDPAGKLEVFAAFWSFAELPSLMKQCVPLPIVIADLQASLDPRNLEIAQDLKIWWSHYPENFSYRVINTL